MCQLFNIILLQSSKGFLSLEANSPHEVRCLTELMKCIVKEALIFTCISKSSGMAIYWVCCEVQGGVPHFKILFSWACYSENTPSSRATQV
jgi:hypothetical protein